MIDAVPGGTGGLRSPDVARLILTTIITEGYAPGDRLPSERQLGQALGIGRSVVREALRSLALLGIVELRRGDGTYLGATPEESVPRAVELGLLLGPRRTRDLADVGENLEIVMAGLAAERRTEEGLARLEALQLELADPFRRRRSIAAIHRAFHAEIWEAASNATLAGILAGIAALLDISLDAVLEAEDDPQWILDDHALVLDALRYRDESQARSTMAKHLTEVNRRLEPTIARR